MGSMLINLTMYHSRDFLAYAYHLIVRWLTGIIFSNSGNDKAHWNYFYFYFYFLASCEYIELESRYNSVVNVSNSLLIEVVVFSGGIALVCVI